MDVCVSFYVRRKAVYGGQPSDFRDDWVDILTWPFHWTLPLGDLLQASDKLLSSFYFIVDR